MMIKRTSVFLKKQLYKKKLYIVENEKKKNNDISDIKKNMLIFMYMFRLFYFNGKSFNEAFTLFFREGLCH